MIASSITHEDISKRAFLLSKEEKSYDQWVWLLAEAELRLQLGKDPPVTSIRSIAEEIGKQKISLQDLHWYIAEKQLLFEHKQKK